MLMKRFIPFVKSEPTVNVVRLQGAISNSGSGLDDPSLAPVIEKAFTKGKPDAVALQVNCPGGSPVQSSLIAARIQRLAEEKDVPVYAFVEDVAASGGYWLATAADEIFIDHRFDRIGSIGVISCRLRLDRQRLDKIGAERRVLHGGQIQKQCWTRFKALKMPADVKAPEGAGLKTLTSIWCIKNQ